MLRHASKPLCAAPKNGCCGMLRLHMLGQKPSTWRVRPRGVAGYRPMPPSVFFGWHPSFKALDRPRLGHMSSAFYKRPNGNPPKTRAPGGGLPLARPGARSQTRRNHRIVARNAMFVPSPSSHPHKTPQNDGLPRLDKAVLAREGGTSSIRQLLGAADTQTAHPATFSTAPTHQPLGSANAETTPARALAAAADRKQRPDATCKGKNG